VTCIHPFAVTHTQSHPIAERVIAARREECVQRGSDQVVV
jgi:hypothetical protein